MKLSDPYFVFDVESIGLYGEGFAVAGGVFREGKPVEQFCFACDPSLAMGDSNDREWVKANVPKMDYTQIDPLGVRLNFWSYLNCIRERYGKEIPIFAECLYPVEAKFFMDCIKDDPSRKWDGPYPFHDIATMMLCAGLDPMITYERFTEEEPAHHPTGDARLSARLLYSAMVRINNLSKVEIKKPIVFD